MVSKYAPTTHSHAKVAMDTTVNLKLLDDYSGPVLALRRLSFCEAVGGLAARRFDYLKVGLLFR